MSKITQTVLDPTKKVGHVSFSSEHDQPQYFDTKGNRIALIEQEIDYKPQYDFETRSIKHWWFRNESELFRDVHTKIATFRSRTAFGKYWKALRITLADKYIWRHFHN